MDTIDLASASTAGGLPSGVESVPSHGGGLARYCAFLEPTSAHVDELRRVAERLVRLRHPNLAIVADLALDGDTVRLTVEEPLGTPLSEYIRGRETALAEIRSLAVQLASALSYLHAQVPHAALHLEHVLVSGGRLTLTGANFLPFPWLQWQDIDASPLNAALQAPDGESGSIETSDVFAVGAVLHHMLTGIATGPASSAWGPAAGAFEYFVRDAVAPSSLKPHVPASWDAVVVRALATSPAERYASTGLLRDALAALPTDPVSGRASEPVAPAIATALTLDPSTFRDPDDTDLDEGEQRSWNRVVVAGLGGFAVAGAVAAGIIAFTGPRGTTTPAVVAGLRVSERSVRSGASVHLKWLPVAGAVAYRVRVTKERGKTTQVTVTHPSYTVRRAVGPQSLQWLVSAYVRGAWGPFSPPARISVAPPRVDAPQPTSPTSGARVRAGSVRFCWREVPHASKYLLRVGSSTVSTTGTCAARPLAAGRYSWSAAAQVRGARLVTGPYAASRSLTVVRASVAQRNRTGRARNGRKRTPTAASNPPASAPVATAVPPVAQAPVASAPTPVPVAPTPVAPAPVAPAPVAPAPVAPAPTAAPTAASGSGCVPFINC